MKTPKIENSLVPGFTILEVLVSLSLIFLFLGFGTSTYHYAQLYRERAQARSEMEKIGSYLDVYRNENGDYPWGFQDCSDPFGRLKSGFTLYAALTGKRNVRGDLIRNDNRIFHTEALLEAEFSIQKEGGQGVIVDPWGNPYVYLYRRTSVDPLLVPDWPHASYILISLGPKGCIEKETDKAKLILPDQNKDWLEYYRMSNCIVFGI